MKPGIIHSIAVCLAVLLLPLMMACGSQEESLLEDISEATLYLHIEPVGRTRAGASVLPDKEKMNNVRVIILHQDGTVEHNKFYSLDGAQAQESVLLKVTPNEKKKVFLFANEESVTLAEGVDIAGGNRTLSAFLDSYQDGSSGFEDAVNDLYFAPDYTGGRGIPMSSMYEVQIPEKGIVEKTFYVVRVATKFTVNFFNRRAEEVDIENLTIASHADRNYLMAHVRDTEQNRVLFNGKTWIEWLREVSEASSENDDYATTENAGWLKDYRLPDQADKNRIYSFPSPVTVPSVEFDEGNPDDIKAGEESVEFYLPESMNLKAGATDGEQEYILTLKVSGLPEPFVCRLPNLKALFRNTNVVVNITMDRNMEMTVDVIPFTSVEIEPDYGLTREDFTGYIVGKDNAGKKCWYDGQGGIPLYLGPKDKPEEFVNINGKNYLLVYTDYERTAANLDHFFEKETRKKYLLDPAGRTGYENVNWTFYLNNLKQRVWLDEDFRLKCCRTLNEWNRLEWNKAYWDKDATVNPRFWFDVLGNRYPWSLGDTADKRKKILGEWVQYLE